eukprot:4329737-Prymnesium_polylepis.1
MSATLCAGIPSRVPSRAPSHAPSRSPFYPPRGFAHELGTATQWADTTTRQTRLFATVPHAARFVRPRRPSARQRAVAGTVVKQEELHMSASRGRAPAPSACP